MAAETIKKIFVLKVPVEKAWALLMDVERTPEWVAGVQESTVTGKKPSGLPLKWKERCRVLEHVLEVEHQFIECDENKTARIQSALPMGAELKRNVFFESVGEKVEVTIEFSWDLGMAGAFVDEDELRKTFESNLETTAENWARRLAAS